MRSLVMDRSSGRPGMAAFDGQTLIFETVWTVEPTRAPEWLADVERELAERALPLSAFDQFVCGLGPGSFSGIRACLAALQGMALPGAKPVYGVASAAALALGQARGHDCVTVVGDARRSRLWCITYQVDPGARRVMLADGRRPTHTSGDFALVPAGKLAETVPAGTRIVTPDWARLGDLLTAAFAADRLVPEARFPAAADVGRVALADPDACVFEPVPVYLHPAVAVKAG